MFKSMYPDCGGSSSSGSSSQSTPNGSPLKIPHSKKRPVDKNDAALEKLSMIIRSEAMLHQNERRSTVPWGIKMNIIN
eukprot:1056950-Rhodomonas_salina.1